MANHLMSMSISCLAEENPFLLRADASLRDRTSLYSSLIDEYIKNAVYSYFPVVHHSSAIGFNDTVAVISHSSFKLVITNKKGEKRVKITAEDEEVVREIAGLETVLADLTESNCVPFVGELREEKLVRTFRSKNTLRMETSLEIYAPQDHLEGEYVVVSSRKKRKVQYKILKQK